MILWQDCLPFDPKNGFFLNSGIELDAYFAFRSLRHIIAAIVQADDLDPAIPAILTNYHFISSLKRHIFKPKDPHCTVVVNLTSGSEQSTL